MTGDLVNALNPMSTNDDTETSMNIHANGNEYEGARRSVVVLLAALAAAASLAAGCTLGVDAETVVIEAEASGEGATEFEVTKLALEDELAIRGGSPLFTAVGRVTAWRRPGDDFDVNEVTSLGFQRAGSIVRPTASVSSRMAEFVTLRDLRFDVPDGVGVTVTVSNPVKVLNIEGPVFVHSEGGIVIDGVTGTVSARSELSSAKVFDVDGSVSISAQSVEVARTGPASINANSSVIADIDRGGEITVQDGRIDVEITGDEFDELVLDAIVGSVEVTLPPDTGWVLDIVGGTATTSEEEQSSAVSIRVGETDFSDGFVDGVFQIGLGGPRIVIRGDRIKVREQVIPEASPGR